MCKPKEEKKVIDKTLTVKSSAVREAMKQCPDAKRILETVFPSLKGDGYAEVPPQPGSVTIGSCQIFNSKHPLFDKVKIRSGGDYKYKGLWVSKDYIPEFFTDKNNNQVIRFKKQQ